MKSYFVLFALLAAGAAHAAPKSQTPKASSGQARYIGTWAEAASSKSSIIVLVLLPNQRYERKFYSGEREKISSLRSRDTIIGRWEFRNGLVVLKRDLKLPAKFRTRGYARLSRDGKTMKVSFIEPIEVPIHNGKKRTVRTENFRLPAQILHKGAPNLFTFAL